MASPLSGGSPAAFVENLNALSDLAAGKRYLNKDWVPITERKAKGIATADIVIKAGEALDALRADHERLPQLLKGLKAYKDRLKPIGAGESFVAFFIHLVGGKTAREKLEALLPAVEDAVCALPDSLPVPPPEAAAASAGGGEPEGKSKKGVGEMLKGVLRLGKSQEDVAPQAVAAAGVTPEAEMRLHLGREFEQLRQIVVNGSPIPGARERQIVDERYRTHLARNLYGVYDRSLELPPDAPLGEAEGGDASFALGTLLRHVELFNSKITEAQTRIERALGVSLRVILAGRTRMPTGRGVESRDIPKEEQQARWRELKGQIVDELTPLLTGKQPFLLPAGTATHFVLFSATFDTHTQQWELELINSGEGAATDWLGRGLTTRFFIPADQMTSQLVIHLLELSNGLGKRETPAQTVDQLTALITRQTGAQPQKGRRFRLQDQSTCHVRAAVEWIKLQLSSKEAKAFETNLMGRLYQDVARWATSQEMREDGRGTALLQPLMRAVRKTLKLEATETGYPQEGAPEMQPSWYPAGVD